MSSTQIENEAVQWTNDFLCSNQPVGQGPAFVRARRLGRKDVRVSCVEYSNRLAANLKHPALAARNI